MKVAIVIPAYNEAATIAGVVRDVAAFGTVIVVDDCSTDTTAALAREAGAEVVSHDLNRGYDGALQSGFEKAAELDIDITATFDADGQHGATTLAAILEPLTDGRVDLVLGLRAKPARIAERLFSRYTRLRFGVGDILCGLKGYRMSLYHQHGRFDGSRSIGTELALYALKQGSSFTTAPVPIHPRIAGNARFGGTLKANGRILRALFLAMMADLRGHPGSRTEAGNPATRKV